MNLLDYLNTKPVKAFFCPFCFNWHYMSEVATIADLFRESREFWCDNKRSFLSEHMGYPSRTYKHYFITFKNESLYISSLVNDINFDRVKCLEDVQPIEGSISIQDIASNFIHSKILNGYLDIYFHIDCHPPFCCSKCGIYGQDEYFYKCQNFEYVMTQNVLYYREHDIRPHYTIMLGLRYELAKGDYIFNTEKLFRVYNLLKRELFASQSHISVLKNQIYMLKKYVVKDSNDLQVLDISNKELETLLSKLVKLNQKVSKLYGESEASIETSKKYDEDSKIRKQVLMEIYPSIEQNDYRRRYAFYQRKVREYVEQKAAEILKIYTDIQADLNNIKDRIQKISEMLKEIQDKYPLVF